MTRKKILHVWRWRNEETKSETEAETQKKQNKEKEHNIESLKYPKSSIWTEGTDSKQMVLDL